MTDKSVIKDIITSRQNPTVKRLCALLDKKLRRKERVFRFDGIKLLCEAATKNVDIELIVVSEAIDNVAYSKISNLIADGKIAKEKILCVSEQVFEKISEELSPEGVITVARYVDTRHRELANVSNYSIDLNERILLAESLRDPGNLGTVIRTSAALGIDRLIITDDCADIYNPKTVRATMGGLFSLNIDIVKASELAELVTVLKNNGRRIYAAALSENAKEIGTLELLRGDAFLIGNEGHGLSAEAIAAASDVAIIPMTEGSESLNAAAAAAICIWETVRVK